MNRPHGLYLVNLDCFGPGATHRPLRQPFLVHEQLKNTEEGITTVYLYVTEPEDEQGTRLFLATAFCNFVQDDYATRDAAAQWLLDMATLRHSN